MSVLLPKHSLKERAQQLEGGTEAELVDRYEEALNRLPSRAPIYTPTDKMPLPNRVAGVERVSDIYKQRLKPVYQPALRELRKKFAGKNRCFVIGNGPSLNLTDLSQLKDEVTFCVNSFFLKMPELNWTPTFYVVEDHLVAEDRAEAINALKGPTKLFPAYLGYCIEEAEDTIFFNHRPRKSYPHGFDFTTDASEITYTGCTVTFTCMQLAHYLGFEEIYLIGVDASYDIPKDVEQGKDYEVGVLDMKSDDPNHFHPDYFGKGFRWHDPQVHKMLEAYEEARKVTDQLGRPIYNATVGGQLEVFERRAFGDIFPSAVTPEKLETALDEDDHAATVAARAELIRERDEQLPVTRLSDYPRVLLLDMTKSGGGTATGELKSTLFGNWPSARLMQVFSNGRDTLGVQGGDVPRNKDGVKFSDTTELSELIRRYDPDVVLYRPLADKPGLHDFSMQTIRDLDLPLVTWIMDDWPERLRHKDEAAYQRFDADLRELFNHAQSNLSICQAMSDAFAERYGVEFKPFANAIDPVDWEKRGKPEPKPGDRLVIRYGGGLAPDMGLESVLRVARAVDRLSVEYPISLEINTHQHWLRQSGHHFERLRGVSIEAENRDTEAYFDWLSGADMLLIAYNFDDEALRYVRYSMANKMPECLASASPVLVHGSLEIATVSYIDSLGCARIVSEPDDASVEAELRWALENRTTLFELGQKAREIAFERHNLERVSGEFRDVLRAAAKAGDREEVHPDWSVVEEVREWIRNPKPVEDVAENKARPEVYKVQSGIAGQGVARPNFVEEAARPTARAVAPATRPAESAQPGSHFRSTARPGLVGETLEFFMGKRGVAAALILVMFLIPAIVADNLLERATYAAPALGVVGMLVLWSRIYNNLLREAERVQSGMSQSASRLDRLSRAQRDVTKAVAEIGKGGASAGGADVASPAGAQPTFRRKKAKANAAKNRKSRKAVPAAIPSSSATEGRGNFQRREAKGAGKKRKLQRKTSTLAVAKEKIRQAKGAASETTLAIGGSEDSLTKLRGLGPSTSRQLEEIGIKSVQQLARMTESELKDLYARIPGFEARAERYKIIEQSKELAE